MWDRLRRLEHHLQGRFVAGVLVLIPALVTYLVVRALVGVVDGAVTPVLRFFLDGHIPPWTFPAVSVLVALLLVYLVGVFVAFPIGHRLVNRANALMERIPVVRPIYRASRQAAEVLRPSEEGRFRRAVFLEYPRPGIRSLGLVTGTLTAGGRRKLVVYIPTVPNPTSGFLALVDEDQVEDAGLTVEEVFKIVLSGGILAEEARVNGLSSGSSG